MSEQRGCGLLLVVRGTCRYRAVGRTENDQVRHRVRELEMLRRRFGYRRLHAMLQREGYEVNHKRVYRIYVEEQLWVRRKRRLAMPRTAMLSPTAINEVWSMDFLGDALLGGRRFRTLNIADDFSREAAANRSRYQPERRALDVLDRLKIERGFAIAHPLRQWARSLSSRRWSSGPMRTASSGTSSVWSATLPQANPRDDAVQA